MKGTVFCPMCETEREMQPGTVREECKVRGETIAIDVPRLSCVVCGESLVDEAFGDPTLHVYAEYRRRHGLLSPEQIRGIREKYDLSQHAFASLLGTSPATFAHYEGGSLQDKAYDRLIRACENPAFVADLVSREGSNSQRASCKVSKPLCAGFEPLRWHDHGGDQEWAQ